MLLDKELTIGSTTGSTVDLLKQIEDSANVSFSYSNKLCLRQNISLSINRNTIRRFVYEIFADCHVTLSEKKNKIIIVPDESLKIPQKYNVHGFVVRKNNGESLIGASVYESSNWLGVTTNNFGYYNLNLEKGEVIINCSYVGFHSIQHRFNLDRDTMINFELVENALISEVPVVSFVTPEGINSSRNSTINLPVEQIRKVPAFLGEVDVARTLQLLPGINGGSEGVSGLYVRGGGSDQNLFLLDDVPVYNISHLFGFFSVFNEDAINKVTVTKGGFPARYGGRLSSVVDVRLKDGNNSAIHGTVSLGMMSSKLALDGPVYNENTTFSLSFRRSYYDLVSYLLQQSTNARTSFYFYDSNAKITHKINDKNRLFVSFYSGRDKVYTKYNFQKIRNPNQPEEGDEQLDINDENYSSWGNTVASFRWNTIYSNKLFSNISLAYSNYTYSVGYEEHFVTESDWNYFEQKYYSGIKDGMAKIDYDYFFKPDHHVRFGGNYIFHTFNPGADLIRESSNAESVVDSTVGGNNVHGNEFYLYLEDDFNLTQSIKINTGLHMSFYGIKDKIYKSLEPRFSVRYLVFPRLALKGSFSRMTQYMHLLTSSSVSLPTDLWIPVTEDIKPQYATEYSLGCKLEIKKGFDFSVIGYFKKYINLLAYGEESASGLYSNLWNNNLYSGNGKSKGVELLLHKKTGKFSGWVGYTLAKSEQSFAELNNGVSFPTTNDRRHDIGIFANYVLNSKVDLSVTWLFGAGNSFTLPSQKYYSPGLPSSDVDSSDKYSEYISTYNGYKMPVFHRLDIGANFKKKNKLGERVWSIGIYNVYGRQNAFSLYFSNSEDNSGNITRELKQLSIFPFPIPYIRYTLRF